MTNLTEKKEYETMDDSVKSFVEMQEKITKRNANLANQITWYAQDNVMSLKEVMECVEIVKEAFHEAAIIKKAE